MQRVTCNVSHVTCLIHAPIDAHMQRSSSLRIPCAPSYSTASAPVGFPHCICVTTSAGNIDVCCITEFVGDVCINAGNTSTCVATMALFNCALTYCLSLLLLSISFQLLRREPVIVARTIRRRHLPHRQLVNPYTPPALPPVLFCNNRSRNANV